MPDHEVRDRREHLLLRRELVVELVLGCLGLSSSASFSRLLDVACVRRVRLLRRSCRLLLGAVASSRSSRVVASWSSSWSIADAVVRGLVLRLLELRRRAAELPMNSTISTSEVDDHRDDAALRSSGSACRPAA